MNRKNWIKGKIPDSVIEKRKAKEVADAMREEQMLKKRKASKDFFEKRKNKFARFNKSDLNTDTAGPLLIDIGDLDYTTSPLNE